jgi:two-component system, OmpR family, KDP operon response regulator KdpE
VAQLRELFGPTEIKFSIATTAQEGLRLLYDRRPHLILLNLIVSGMDGWAMLNHIRAFSDVPILLLVPQNDPAMIVHGFDAGALDVVVTPFIPIVLLARIRAILRLTHPIPTPGSGYTDDYLQINPQRQKVYVQGAELHLTSIERKLLLFLVERADQICTFEEILEHVWGWEYKESKQYVHIYIARLRQKIEVNPKAPRYLLGQHRVGYQFRQA